MNEFFIISIVIISLYLLIFVVLHPIIDPYIQRKAKEAREAREELLSSFIHKMNDSIQETKLYNDNPFPTEEDIQLYYEMYLIKWHRDNDNTWTNEKPMSFEEWEKYTKSDGLVNRYKFMIPETMDMFTGGLGEEPPQMIRLRDYRSKALEKIKCQKES